MGNPFITYIGNQAESFKGIRRNARVMLSLEPLFGIPWGLVSTYAALYMKGLHLTPWQIGMVGTVGSASTLLLSFAGGYVTDRLGRRKCLLLCDLIGWTAVILVWIRAEYFWHFLLAAALNGFTSVSGTAWSCMLVENTEPEQRKTVFTIRQMMWILSGFITPVAGVIVARYGLISATRYLYAFLFVSATALNVSRYLLTTESPVGMERMKATSSHSMGDILKEYGTTIKELMGNATVCSLLVVNVVLALRDSLSGPFSSIYMNGRLGITADWIAAFPTVSAVVSLAVLVTGISFPKLFNLNLSLQLGIVLQGISVILLLAAPYKGFAFLIVSAIAGAGGGALMGPAFSAAWNNAAPDGRRAQLTSFLGVMTSVFRLPGGWISGILYGISPRLPFLSSLGLTACSMVFLFWSMGKGIGKRPGKIVRSNGKADMHG